MSVYITTGSSKLLLRKVSTLRRNVSVFRALTPAAVSDSHDEKWQTMSCKTKIRDELGDDTRSRVSR